ANVQNNLRHTPVSGVVYAFHKARGTLSWHFPHETDKALSQMLLLERFEELPVLLFTARVNKAIAQGGNQQTVSTMSIDKRTGKLVYDRDSYANSMFHALKVDRRAGTVDLVSHNLTLRHFVEGYEAEAGKPADGPPAGGAAPRATRVPQ